MKALHLDKDQGGFAVTAKAAAIALRPVRFRPFIIFPLVLWLLPSASLLGTAQANTPLAQSESADLQPKALSQPPLDTSANQDASAKRLGQLTLDVTVTDASGQPVSGLSEGDFTIRDNQQPSKIVSFRAADGGGTT